MARKQKFEGGTKNRIIEVGCKMFLENGFDGTGIRAVMERVGADVGVFYYYFNTKDDLFSDVLERLMEPYKPTFEQMVEDAKADPFAELLVGKGCRRGFGDHTRGYCHQRPPAVPNSFSL